MTVVSSIQRNDYTGTGTTGPFAYGFRIFAATDLRVLIADLSGTETTLSYPAQYTVSGVGVGTGGAVTLATALTSGYALSIQRNVPITQARSVRNQGPFFAATLEDALDQLTMIDQQQQDGIDRSFKLPSTLSAAAASTEINPFTPSAYLRVRADGLGIESVADVVASQNFLQSGAGAVTRSANSKMADWVSLRDFDDSAGGGVADDRATVVRANAAFPSGGLVVPPGTYRIASNLTISNAIEFMPGAILKPDNGVTVTIAGALVAGPWKIFDTSAGGTVTFSTIRIVEAYAEWFGALGDGVQDDAPLIQAAINACYAAMIGTSAMVRLTLRFLPSVYLCKSLIKFLPFVNYEGTRSQTADADATFTYANSSGTVIRAHTSLYTNAPAGAGVHIYIPAGPVVMRRMQFVGTAAITGNPSIGIQWGSTGGVANTGRPHETDGTGQNCSGNIMEDVTFWTYTAAWEANNLSDSYGRGVRFEACTKNIKLGSNAQVGMQFGNDFELHGTEMYGHAVGIGCSDTTAKQTHRVRLFGGVVESYGLNGSIHFAYDSATSPKRLSLESVGVQWLHDSAATSTRHLLIDGCCDPPSAVNTALSRTTNVVTVTTAAPHPFDVGQRVVVTGADAGFNGTFTVTAVPTPTSYRYAQVAGNAVSVAFGTTAATESPLSFRFTGGEFLGSTNFIGRGAGSGQRINAYFSGVDFRNCATQLSVASHVRWQGGRWENSSVAAATSNSCSVCGVDIDDVPGTAIDLADAGANQPNWRIKDNAFTSVTTPIGLLAAATNSGYDIDGNTGSGVANNRRGTVTLVAGVAAVVLATTEASAAYQVIVSGDANETFKVTAQTTTGFTITSSNAASTAHVSYRLFV